MSKDEVFNKVQGVLVDALGVDTEDVKPDARLVGDLGAESIDFLDIVFRLEKAFGIKVNQGDLFPESVLNDPKYVVDGKVTDHGMTELKAKLPYMKLDAFEANRKKDEFANFFTVDDIANFVQTRLS